MPALKGSPQHADPKSFGEFVLRMRQVDRALDSFIAHLKSEPLPPRHFVERSENLSQSFGCHRREPHACGQVVLSGAGPLH
jgi:hypothetical protein